MNESEIRAAVTDDLVHLHTARIEIPCAEPIWLVAEWPDGTWCDLHELREMTHMSDDYQIVRVLTHDEGYTPIKTQRWSKIAND